MPLTNLTIPHYNLTHTAALLNSMIACVGHADRTSGGYRAEVVGVGGNHLDGGLLLLSAAFADRLHEVIDWDEIDGVFSYEYLEVAKYDDDSALPCFVISRITDDDLLQVAGNHVVTATAIALVDDWIKHVKLPTKKFPTINE